MVKIGVLGLQGAVREHVKSVEASGAEAVVVKDQIDTTIHALHTIGNQFYRGVKS